jgi:hypothetical protein
MTLHLTEPYSCRSCKHHAVYARWTPSERLVCMKDPHGVSCAFARAADGYGSCPMVDGKPKNFEAAT